jgi:hypothetical protein
MGAYATNLVRSSVRRKKSAIRSVEVKSTRQLSFQTEASSLFFFLSTDILPSNWDGNPLSFSRIDKVGRRQDGCVKEGTVKI